LIYHVFLYKRIHHTIPRLSQFKDLQLTIPNFLSPFLSLSPVLRLQYHQHTDRRHPKYKHALARSSNSTFCSSLASTSSLPKHFSPFPNPFIFKSCLSRDCMKRLSIKNKHLVLDLMCFI
jgi:hypothetical protein